MYLLSWKTCIPSFTWLRYSCGVQAKEQTIITVLLQHQVRMNWQLARGKVTIVIDLVPGKEKVLIQNEVTSDIGEGFDRE